MAGNTEFESIFTNPNLFWGTIVGSLMFTFIPPFVKMLIQLLFCKSEPELKQQILVLKAELAKINMVDEFSKYAKLERRIRKLSDDAANEAKARFLKEETIKVAINAVLHVFGVAFGLSMLWMYRQEPVLIVNENWLYPLNSLLSYPTGVPGAVGFTAWAVTCGRVARIAAQATTYGRVARNPAQTIK